MIVEIIKFPKSQEVMDNPDWFPIGDYGVNLIIGDSAYARVLDESEYILVEKTTADEFNMKEHETLMKLELSSDFISARDPGDENGTN